MSTDIDDLPPNYDDVVGNCDARTKAIATKNMQNTNCDIIFGTENIQKENK